MEDQTNEPTDVESTSDIDDIEQESSPTDDVNELKARIKKLEEGSITQRERTRALRRELEKARKDAESRVDVQSKSTSGILDETQLDYLDLKGITNSDEIEVIEKVMQKTGQSFRQVLKDDYVIAKLEKLRATRELKDATPSSSKRSGTGPQTDLATAIAQFDANGTLPSDYKFRTEVVNAITERGNPNKPAWH